MTPHAYYNEHAAYPADRLEDLIREGLIPYGTVDRRDIQDVQPEDLAGFTQCHFFAGIGGWAYACRLAGWPDDRPIWTGSCPCQPFSVAGRGRGTADARHLWPDFLRLIRACRPPVVVGEQVAGAAGTAWFSGVRADLAAEAYAVRGVDVTAYAIGAPHERQRLYWLGHANRPREQQPKGHIGDIRGRTGNTDAPRRMEHAAGIGRREGWPEQQGRIGVLSPASADAQSGMGNAVRTRSPISEAKSGAWDQRMADARGIQLNDQMTPASGLTLKPSGASGTKSGGAPNPKFPGWLMGYPEGWALLRPTETPSSPRSRRKSSPVTSKPMDGASYHD